MVQTGGKVSTPSSSSYARKDLEFFKVFLPEFSSRQLAIPQAFVDMLEKPLPNEALLLDEMGRSWGVETKTEEKIGLLFQKGWGKFANDQSLEFGDFLLFRYDGVSRFSVTIFAKDGCKKNLCAATATDGSRVSVKKEPVVAKPVAIPTKPDRRDGCRKPRVKETRKRDSSKEPEFVSTVKTEPEHWGDTRRKFNRAGGFEESVRKPKYPHFVRNITNGTFHRLEIPSTFLKSTGIELEEDVELCDEDGKKWPLKIVNHGRGLRFSHDPWLCFCKTHKLKKTNKCLFEFVVTSHGRCNEIQVRIFRGRLLTTNTKTNYQVLAM